MKGQRAKEQACNIFSVQLLSIQTCLVEVNQWSDKDWSFDTPAILLFDLHYCFKNQFLLYRGHRILQVFIGLFELVFRISDP